MVMPLKISTFHSWKDEGEDCRLPTSGVNEATVTVFKQRSHETLDIPPQQGFRRSHRELSASAHSGHLALLVCMGQSGPCLLDLAPA